MTTLPSWAVPGRKVVCVDDTFPGYVVTGNDKFLTKGEIYTIKSAVFWEGEPGINLKEITRPISPDHGERLPYWLRRFRPLITQEEDMLTFRSLLNTVPSNLTLETTL